MACTAASLSERSWHWPGGVTMSPRLCHVSSLSANGSRVFSLWGPDPDEEETYRFRRGAVAGASESFPRKEAGREMRGR